MTAFDMAQLWADTLADDAALQQKILQDLGIALHIYVGFDAVAEVGEADAPYALFSPVSETRGPVLESEEHSIMLYLGISKEPDPQAEEAENGVIINAAQSYMEQVFCPAIMNSLHALGELAPEQAAMESMPPVNSYCEKWLELSVTLPNVIGRKNYWD
jgi:hypothetical protein